MPSKRIDDLVSRLEKSLHKTDEFLNTLTPEQWQTIIYEEPAWNICNILAHFVFSEQQLLVLAQNVASGGPGAPYDLKIDVVNAQGQDKLQGQSPQELLDTLKLARQETINWLRAIDESKLDNEGKHPALGVVKLETMIVTIVGHQLIHMRDISRRL